MGVSRIIDLRSQKERRAQLDPFSHEYGAELITISLFDDLSPYQQPQGNALQDPSIHALETQGPMAGTGSQTWNEATLQIVRQ
ncbi:hypothetical protein H5024_02750 [Ochrobactrum sp. Marseille-Q0166]|nr:hypothetical protein [Ochrobactrum sp. Marseille-Q0166]